MPPAQRLIKLMNLDFESSSMSIKLRIIKKEENMTKALHSLSFTFPKSRLLNIYTHAGKEICALRGKKGLSRAKLEIRCTFPSMLILQIVKETTNSSHRKQTTLYYEEKKKGLSLPNWSQGVSFRACT